MNTNPSIKHRRTRIVQAVVAGAFAVVATANPGSPADASHAVEGPGPTATSPQHTVITPCFDVPTPDRWPADAGAVPGCSHVYDAVD